MIKRCEWVTEENLYIEYHDKEWGVPVYDDRKLFEMLCLEGAQAGLSWWTILKKRENYKKAFDNFEAEKIVNYTEEKLEELISKLSHTSLAKGSDPCVNLPGISCLISNRPRK